MYLDRSGSTGSLCERVALAAIVACSRAPPLANTHSSASSLASAVLDALARRDRAALKALALNETEFRDHVWPELPAARPERNLPFSYVWGELRQKSLQALAAGYPARAESDISSSAFGSLTDRLSDLSRAS